MLNVIALVLMAAATLWSLYWGIRLLIVAFQQSLFWGLAYIFIPFASLAFVITHWEESKLPFLRGLMSFPVMLLAVVLLAFGSGQASPERIAPERVVPSKALNTADQTETMVRQAMNDGEPVASATPSGGSSSSTGSFGGQLPETEPPPPRALPPEAERGPLSARELRGAPGDVDRVNRERRVTRVPLDNARGAIGQRVEVEEVSGKTWRGVTLQEVTDTHLVFHQRLGGGDMKFTIPRWRIRELRIKDE